MNVTRSRSNLTALVMPIVFNADVRVLDRSGTVADAVAWRDGRLIAVGTQADVRRAAGARTEVWDAQGASVLPGFIDAHQHPSIAMLYAGGVRLTRPEVTDIAGLQRKLAQASARLAAGDWLVAMDWDESKLDEKRPPTRRELDDAVPDRPVFALHYT